LKPIAKIEMRPYKPLRTVFGARASVMNASPRKLGHCRKALLSVTGSDKQPTS
jgi:hypothetical protein